MRIWIQFYFFSGADETSANVPGVEAGGRSACLPPRALGSSGPLSCYLYYCMSSARNFW